MNFPRERFSISSFSFRRRSSSAKKKLNNAPQKPRQINLAPFLDETKFLCPSCDGPQVEPRVLPCLHTFCTRCLKSLEEKERAKVFEQDDEEISEASEFPRIHLECPTCKKKSPIPNGGVEFLVPNYVFENQMVLASLSKDTSQILCDICATDIPAVSRCMDCMQNMCTICTDNHIGQPLTSEHEVLGLRRVKQLGVAKARKKLFCPGHPDQELVLYCIDCRQVLCKECCSRGHRDHSLEPSARLYQPYCQSLRESVVKAKLAIDQASVTKEKLQNAKKQIETRCDAVRTEIEDFISAYSKALAEHRLDLLRRIEAIRAEKIDLVLHQLNDLDEKLDGAHLATDLAGQLLAEGSEVEILGLYAALSEKLDISSSEGRPAEDIARDDDIVQFLPEEKAREDTWGNTLYGVITTQTVEPDKCCLLPGVLENVRVHRRVEVILETRDSAGNPLAHGNEPVKAELRCPGRILNVAIFDRRDGTYTLSFTPDTPGKLSLHVFVKGQPIMGSPYAVRVRTLRPHQGMFHCCTFCSSSGAKETTCGCGGTMPGGFKGCGHGHEGHPGRRHWSCCGNVLEHSECAEDSTQMYQ